MNNKMENLTYIFNSTTREQLVEFITALALAIDPHLIHEGKLPFIIACYGDRKAGKSLVWDKIRETLIGNDAQIDKTYSADLKAKDRVYETWGGVHVKSQRNMRIFNCNGHSPYLYVDDQRGVLSYLEELRQHGFYNNNSPYFDKSYQNKIDFAKLRRRGDLLLLSNTMETPDDISLVLTNTPDRKREEWHRKTELTVENPELKKFPKFQGFLNHYCDIA